MMQPGLKPATDYKTPALNTELLQPTLFYTNV